jgi:hypothetical protein
MKNRVEVLPSVLRLRIGRLVVDAGVLDGITRGRLIEQMQTELARRLSETSAAPKPPTLAGHIADAVLSQVQPRLPFRKAGGGWNGDA